MIESCFDALYEFPQLFVPRKIGRVREGTAAATADLARHLLQKIGAASHQTHLGTQFGES